MSSGSPLHRGVHPWRPQHIHGSAAKTADFQVFKTREKFSMKKLVIFSIGISMLVPYTFAESALENSAQAQPNPLLLTLDEVLRMMLENNLNVRVNELPPQVAQSLIGIYFRPFEPTLHLSATGTRGTTPGSSQLSGATSLLQLTHTYDIGIGQTLRTGTSYGVDVVLNRTSSNNAFSLYNPSWLGQVRYSLTQHLLQNRGSIVNDHSIRIQQNNQRISESQFEQQMMDLVGQAQNTYWDYVFSIEDVKVKERSLHLAEKTLDENQKKVAAGLLAPLDVVQAESQVASTQDAVVVSTYSSRQNEDQLKRTITSQTDPGLALAKLTPIDVLRRPESADVVPVTQAIQIALENRPEMRQARLAVENAEIDTTYTKNQTLPLLDINAGYTQNGLGGVQRLRSALGGTTITGLVPGGIGDALSQMFGLDYKTYSLGFNLQIPLSNTAARSDHDRAVSAKELAQAQMDATEQEIALEVRNAMNQVEMNRAHIESAGKARDLSQKTVDAEQKKYELGVSTLFFVLQAQTNLAIAETNEIQALVNYTKALVTLDRATGQTLLHNHIEIERTKPQLVANAGN
jgi:outer membrane protein